MRCNNSTYIVHSPKYASPSLSLFLYPSFAHCQIKDYSLCVYSRIAFDDILCRKVREPFNVIFFLVLLCAICVDVTHTHAHVHCTYFTHRTRTHTHTRSNNNFGFGSRDSIYGLILSPRAKHILN